MMVQDNDARQAERRAALLAASFARWQKRHHSYPVTAPVSAQGMLPMSLGRTRRVLESARQDGEHGERTARCVARMLRACEHDKLGEVVPTPLLQLGGHRLTYDELANSPGPDSWSDTAIHFQPGSLITTVKAYSVFNGVSSERAAAFMQQAEPPNWSDRSEFFKQSVPGRWDAAADEFIAGTAGDKYHLLEEAEWNWSPEFTGGAYNVLEIEKSPLAAPRTMAVDTLSKLTVDGSSDAVKQEWTRILGDHFNDPPRGMLIQFKYGLFRSLRIRLLAAWLSGGLSKDDGTFTAAWFPRQGDHTHGVLCIAADKMLCFSRQADAVEDYSRLLNLMAPALSSLLMDQLIHDGIVDFLLPPNDQARPVIHRGGDRPVAAAPP